jgi:hypothetical protein
MLDKSNISEMLDSKPAMRRLFLKSIVPIDGKQDQLPKGNTLILASLETEFSGHQN